MTIKNPTAPATEAQVRMIERLIDSRDLLADEQTFDAVNAMDAGEYAAFVGRLKLKDRTKGEASKTIEWLMALPAQKPTGDLAKVVEHLTAKAQAGKLSEFEASLFGQYQQRGTLSEKQIACVVRRLDGTTTQNAAAAPLIPRGRYAITLNGQLALVHVWRGTRNPNVQRIYTVASHDDEGTRLNPANELAVAQAIAADPGKAAQEFGRRTGHCYRCATALEKNISRHLAVGPECMKHVFDNDRRLAMLREAREQLRAAGIEPEDKFDDLAAAA